MGIPSLASLSHLCYNFIEALPKRAGGFAPTLRRMGNFFAPFSKRERGWMLMYVTYSDLFAYTAVLVSVAMFTVTLITSINKKK